MKKIFKRLEQITFICINLLLSASCFVVYWIMGLSGWLSLNVNHADFNGENDGYYVGWIMLLTLAYWLMKLFIFSFLYMAKKIFPYTHDFLKKFLNERHFRNLVLKKAVIMDLSIFLLTVIIYKLMNNDDFDMWFIIETTYLLYGGGVLTSYLLFIFNNKLYLLAGRLGKTNNRRSR